MWGMTPFLSDSLVLFILKNFRINVTQNNILMMLSIVCFVAFHIIDEQCNRVKLKYRKHRHQHSPMLQKVTSFYKLHAFVSHLI